MWGAVVVRGTSTDDADVGSRRLAVNQVGLTLRAEHRQVRGELKVSVDLYGHRDVSIPCCDIKSVVVEHYWVSI